MNHAESRSKSMQEGAPMRFRFLCPQGRGGSSPLFRTASISQGNRAERRDRKRRARGQLTALLGTAALLGCAGSHGGHGSYDAGTHDAAEADGGAGVVLGPGVAELADLDAGPDDDAGQDVPVPARVLTCARGPLRYDLDAIDGVALVTCSAAGAVGRERYELAQRGNFDCAAGGVAFKLYEIGADGGVYLVRATTADGAAVELPCE